MGLLLACGGAPAPQPLAPLGAPTIVTLTPRVATIGANVILQMSGRELGDSPSYHVNPHYGANP
jgi:hypothetical protein